VTGDGLALDELLDDPALLDDPELLDELSELVEGVVVIVPESSVSSSQLPVELSPSSSDRAAGEVVVA
jgi:hypothetical protein